MGVQLLMLALLLDWSYHILFPFVTPIVWGAVLAVALYPVHRRLKRSLKGKGTLAAVIICICMLALVIVPAVVLLLNSADDLEVGRVGRPAPGEKLCDALCRVIGQRTSPC